jgi:2-methylcitrate dehydratase PrpD
MPLTATFGEFIANTSYETLDTSVIDIAKERIIDTIGTILAGNYSWSYKEHLLDIFADSHGDAKVFCESDRTFSLYKAILINSSLAHAAELDDGHKRAGVHAGAVVVPTALTIGMSLGKSGKEILAAVVIGYEIIYRIAVAENPWLIKKGFHPSSICGTLGAAATAAKLLQLDSVQCAHALGMAGLFTGGLMEATVSAQESKCVMVGHSAESGVESAYIARGGIPGATGVFDGPFGLFFSMGKDVDIGVMLRGLGHDYLIGDTYSKFYPTCRHSQPAIEAMIEFVMEKRFVPEEIKRVNVKTYRVAYDLAGRVYEPISSGEAKFSIPYGVAVAAIEGAFTIMHLTDTYYKDPRFIDMARRVEVQIDETVESFYPQKRGAVMNVELFDGKKFVKECFDLKGSPTKPVSREEIIKKFKKNASFYYGDDEIEELIDIFINLENIADITPVMGKICKYRGNGEWIQEG